MTLHHDKVILSVKDVPRQILEVSTPNVDLAKIMERTAGKLQIFRDKIITSLPDLLLEKVLHSLPHPVRPGSKVVVNITKSLSFYIFSYYIECKVDTFAMTNVTHFPMPFIREENVYFSVQIKNQLLTMDQSSGWFDIFATVQTEECNQSALSSQPLPLLPVCPKNKFPPQIIISVYQLTYGNVYLVIGPSMLTLSCFHKTSQIHSISDDFLLFYINKACDFKVKHRSVTKFIKATSDQLEGSDMVSLLQLNIPYVSSFLSKTNTWLLVLTVVLAAISASFCMIIMLIFYCKRKYKPRVVISDEGVFECSLINFDQQDQQEPQVPQSGNMAAQADAVSQQQDQDHCVERVTRPTKPAAH